MSSAIRELRIAPRRRPRSWLESDLRSLCRDDLADEVARIYAQHDWVYDAVKARDDASLLRGRHPVFTAPIGEVHAVVKRLYHGGAMASILQDAFLTSARIRNHLDVTNYLRAQGIATPPVLFASWRRVRGLVRGELATERVGDGADADAYLFAGERPGDWRDLAAKIGTMVASLHHIDFLHRDLNLMNFYFTASKEIYILDLDKSAITNGVLSAAARAKNLARLERSVRKQGRAAEPDYVDAVVRQIHDAYGENYG